MHAKGQGAAAERRLHAVLYTQISISNGRTNHHGLRRGNPRSSLVVNELFKTQETASGERACPRRCSGGGDAGAAGVSQCAAGRA